MRRWLTGLALISLLLSACGESRAVEVEPGPPTTTPRVLGSTREKGGEVVPLEAQATPIAAGNRVAWTRAHLERLWREADALIRAEREREAEEAAAAEESDYSPPAAASSSIDTGYRDVTEPYPGGWEPGTINGYPCGQPLPPCYVMARESGGNPYAVNWGGCNGNNCYGLWQFSGEWDCDLGQPCGIASWTVEQQNAAARTLWAGGAGCSNWSAC